jgi:mono/diheme cytochrome c family protein
LRCALRIALSLCGAFATSAAAQDVEQSIDPSSVCAPELRLFADPDCAYLAEGIYEYEPQYALWSDGAVKWRFIYLPPNSWIDTTNPDRWVFPIGTRLYKTFVREGVMMETRIIERWEDGWTLTSYAWLPDQRSVVLASNEGENTKVRLGIDHQIPSQVECQTCHKPGDMDPVLGFSALQLNWDPKDVAAKEYKGITLASLIDAQWLWDYEGNVNLTVDNAKIPDDPSRPNNDVERAALGYLHGNCAGCHGDGLIKNPDVPRPALKLWAKVGIGSVTDEPGWQNTVCKRAGLRPAGGTYIIEPRNPALSALHWRMSQDKRPESIAMVDPDDDYSWARMPPIATVVPDEGGMKKVADWINTLPPCQ